MDAEQLLALIEAGESLTIELKASLSHRKPQVVCKEIAALAATKGGFLLIGVSDDRQIVGVADACEVRDKIERWAADLIAPAPILDPTVAEVQGKSIVAVEVANGTSPVYSYDGRFYGRIGTSSCALTPNQLIDMIRGRKIEDVIASLESSVALAQVAASTAINSTAPGIMGQGELATMNYWQVRDKIFNEFRSAAAYMSLESAIAVAQSTASLALAGPANSVRNQGDLATSNYHDIQAKLLADWSNSLTIMGLRSDIAALQSSLFSVGANVQALQMRLDKLKQV